VNLKIRTHQDGQSNIIFWHSSVSDEWIFNYSSSTDSLGLCLKKYFIIIITMIFLFVYRVALSHTFASSLICLQTFKKILIHFLFWESQSQAQKKIASDVRFSKESGTYLRLIIKIFKWRRRQWRQFYARLAFKKLALISRLFGNGHWHKFSRMKSTK
jgi:hypothetical protein